MSQMSQMGPMGQTGPMGRMGETGPMGRMGEMGPMTEQKARRALTALDVVSLAVGTIGALNWGLSGAANFNLVRRIFGRGSILERAVYILVGLAGLNLASLTVRYLTSGRLTPMGPAPRRMMAEMQHTGMVQPSTGTMQPTPTPQPGMGQRPGMGTQPGMMR